MFVLYPAEALQEGLAEFEKPENKSRMDEAIQKAQGSPQGLMQYVLPLAIQIKGDILEKYGFTKDQMGAMQLITAIQMHATNDPQMNEQLQVGSRTNKYKSSLVNKSLYINYHCRRLKERYFL